MKLSLFIFPFFILASCSLEKRRDPRPAKEIVIGFYQAYMNKTPGRLTHMKYSEAFYKLFEEHHTVCKIKNENDKCSWNSDRDIYLDTRSIDPKLNFQNSQFSANESEPGKVNIEFKIYKTVHRLGLFMIQAEGEWVVDDIYYNGRSTRQRLRHEVEYYYLHK